MNTSRRSLRSSAGRPGPPCRLRRRPPRTAHTRGPRRRGRRTRPPRRSSRSCCCASSCCCWSCASRRRPASHRGGPPLRRRHRPCSSWSRTTTRCTPPRTARDRTRRLSSSWVAPRPDGETWRCGPRSETAGLDQPIVSEPTREARIPMDCGCATAPRGSSTPSTSVRTWAQTSSGRSSMATRGAVAHGSPAELERDSAVRKNATLVGRPGVTDEAKQPARTRGMLRRRGDGLVFVVVTALGLLVDRAVHRARPAHVHAAFLFVGLRVVRSPTSASRTPRRAS